jgi:hypothetical protein
MEKEDLIKKIEEISLPKIEIKSHKERLKLVLMEKYLPERKKEEFFGILRKLIPAGALAVILFFFIFNSLNSPQRNLAKAREIALKNTEIKDWVAEGAIIKDVEIVDGRAYILIEPPEIKEEKEPMANDLKSAEVPSESSKVKKEEFKGALAEVNIKEKRISNIEKLNTVVTGLIEVKKEKALEIASKSPGVQEIVPKEAEVLNINVSVPKFKLIKEGDSVRVLPESGAEEKASITYQFDESRWEGKINLNEERVEEVNFLGGNQE